MANPNIVNVSAIYGNTGFLSITTSAANVVVNPGGSGAVYKLNTLLVSNINASSSAAVTIELNRSGTNTAIVKNVALATGGSLVAISKDSSLYLLEGDIIQASGNVASSLQAVASWEQIT